MIVSQSIPLLPSLDGRFHASDQAKISIYSQLQDMFDHQVEKYNDCKSFNHTFTDTCWQVSCLRSGENPDFLPMPMVRQCLAIKWGYGIM